MLEDSEKVIISDDIGLTMESALVVADDGGVAATSNEKKEKAEIGSIL